MIVFCHLALVIPHLDATPPFIRDELPGSCHEILLWFPPALINKHLNPYLGLRQKQASCRSKSHLRQSPLGPLHACSSGLCQFPNSPAPASPRGLLSSFCSPHLTARCLSPWSSAPHSSPSSCPLVSFVCELAFHPLPSLPVQNSWGYSALYTAGTL